MKKRLLVLCVLTLAVACVLPSTAMAKTRTKLSVSVTSSYEHFDKDPYISGTLKTSSGRALKNKVVKLYCGSRYIGHQHTNSRGKVKFRAVLPGSAWSGTWRMKYAGSSKYRRVTSAGKSTRLHIHFDDWATYVEAEVDDDGNPIDVGHPTDVFSMDVFLEEGRSYAIEPSESTLESVYDSAGDLVWQSDDYYDWYVFTAAYDDTYTFYFDSGSTDDLSVLVW